MSGRGNILVLYRISNSDSDKCTPLYNCFSMPYGSGLTLSRVKQHCAAAHSLSVLGPEGYHWRVLVEDKVGDGSGSKPYSWWDIQDGNAKLPVKQSSQQDLRRLLHPSKSVITGTDTASKAAKGAFKMMGKMAETVVGDGGETTGPPVAVITFKLVDLVKLHDDSDRAGGSSPHPPPRQRQQPRAARPAPAAAASTRARAAAAAPNNKTRAAAAPPSAAAARARGGPQPAAARQPRRAAAAPPAGGGRPRAQQQQQQQEASLLDFGATTTATPRRPPAAPATGNLRYPNPAAAPPPPAPAPANETRAQRLKREQEHRMKNSNRVWDDVDQRWVEKVPDGKAPPASASATGGGAQKATKVVGVKLDGSGAVGKSATVRAGVSKRVNDMKEAQQKALKEVREREAKKKRDEEEEDVVRKQLEPMIKAWSEEHGKKKQIRALLATLHTVLWQGAKWKQVGIGDLLDDSKVKRCFHRATLVVHPDKTHKLPARERFLAKRIFDALSQAKTEFDDGIK